MPPPALSAQELHTLVRARRGRDLGDLTEPELERWLLQERLAEQTPVGLVPTARAVDLAGGLDLTPVFAG